MALRLMAFALLAGLYAAIAVNKAQSRDKFIPLMEIPEMDMKALDPSYVGITKSPISAARAHEFGCGQAGSVFIYQIAEQHIDAGPLFEAHHSVQIFKPDLVEGPTPFKLVAMQFMCRTRTQFGSSPNCLLSLAAEYPENCDYHPPKKLRGHLIPAIYAKSYP